MKTIRIKLIVPINNNIFNTIFINAVSPVLPPDVIVDVENITQGIRSIQCRHDGLINGPHVAKVAKKAEKEGFDGIFISDMDYCGVEAIREIVNIPVVGAFRASAFTAMMLGNRFSIVTVLDSVADMQREHTHTFGISSRLASVRVVDIPVTSLNNESITANKVYNESLKAIDEDGARAIILGCTGFVEVASIVQKRLSELGKEIPVIDPNRTAIGYLILLIRNNLSQSRLTYHSAFNV